MTTEPRRLPPPWTMTEGSESFAIADAKGQALAYVYFEDVELRRNVMNRLTRDEARRVALGIIRLPELMTADGAVAPTFDALIEDRIAALAGCTEGSEEETELAALTAARDAYFNAKGWSEE